jgi:hypothetical protein
VTSEIIKSDTRLFLFRALEYGFAEKLMDDVFFDKLKREGAQMSFAFAKRYYNVIYEAYLRHASHCVLGIINIGLIESSKSRLDNATNHLIQKSYVGMFREGWTRILNLVQYAINLENISHKTAFEWEKDFAESFSAEPGREWIGYEEYLIKMQIYCG